MSLTAHSLPPVITAGAGDEVPSSLDSLVPLRVDLAGGGDGEPGAVERSYKEVGARLSYLPCFLYHCLHHYPFGAISG